MGLFGRNSNPEGQMPLGDHLKEARNRLFASVAVMLVGAVASAFFINDVYGLLFLPVRQATDNGSVRTASVLGGVDLMIQGSVVMGLIITSPFWVYQIWAYLRPGLTKKEKKYARGFFFAAVPLFLGGIGTAYYIYPYAVRAMLHFNPSGVQPMLDAGTFLQFIVRLHLSFGLAFLVPLILVGINLLGLVTGRQVARSWRVVVFLCVAFAAVAAPGPDVLPMFALAAPMLVLFFFAVILCLFNDRQRERRRASQPTPDEVRPLSEIA